MTVIIRIVIRETFFCLEEFIKFLLPGRTKNVSGRMINDFLPKSLVWMWDFIMNLYFHFSPN